MKKISISTLLVIIALPSFAQEGWNWPEDEELHKLSKEKQAYYKLLLAQDKFKEAMPPLNWLYANNPDLHQTIYIEGESTLKKIMEDIDDKERVKTLKDSVLWMYDQRIEHFDNDAKTMDRKAYQAFQFYYKQPEKYPMLLELYEKAYELNEAKISNFNLNSYMLLAKLSYKNNPQEMPAEKVLDIHSTISDIIEEKKNNGEKPERLNKEQNKTDAWLSSIDGILTCEFIETTLVPKFRENLSDIGIAKKIFKYSVQAKCTGESYFLEASEPVFKDQPSYTLANAIGSRYLASDAINKGLEYFIHAAQLASNDVEKYDALMGQALSYSKKGDKPKARVLAYEALSTKPDSKEAFNLIGNLYFTSFEECQGGESKVLDRGVFLAAYDMYKKAGNSSQMKASKSQFPSVEEIFNENYEEGQNITVGCWIDQTVALKSRD